MHPILGRYAPHYGLDLAAPYGTPIHATADGVVAAVVNSRSYGLGVDIDHGNGYITRYAHASRLVVQKGMRVRQGDVIAYVGSTGLSTGPHCHYEVFHDGWSVDPASLLMRR
jgi:murein DD-endopeptidase MepM/ murein hydrolase activator NlpD